MKTLKRLLVLVVLGATLSCSEKIAAPDTTPPNAVTDLRFQNSSGGRLLLWTAPGDDGAKGQVSRYDIRYTTGNLTNDWESAPTIPSPSRPVGPGATQFVIAPSLQPGTWQFGVRAGDEVPNWSERYIATLTITAPIPPDTIPPAPVTDLMVESITQGAVTLQWTASGDDSLSGRAASHDLRYAIGTITPETWPDATPVAGLGAPRAAGETESFRVTGLEIGQDYGFALRVVDESENWSGLSNVAIAFISPFAPFQLTFSNNYSANGPDWSPDGNSIAFTMRVQTGPETIRPQLHVIAAGGGDPVQYTFFAPEGALNPSWSPDGDRFAFKKHETDGINTFGVLAVMDATPDAAPHQLASYGLESVWWPAWAPDGTRIVYSVARFIPGQPIISDVYTIPSSGGSPTILIEDIEVFGFDWSPDAAQIVYSAKQDGVYNLWVIPSTGGAPTQLTTGSDDKRAPAWSRGGEIAYMAAKTIWVISPSGGDARQATTDTDIVGLALTWSPDGTKIAYEKYTNQIYNIWVTTVE